MNTNSQREPAYGAQMATYFRRPKAPTLPIRPAAKPPVAIPRLVSALGLLERTESQLAVAEDDSYGQAYSAEALWANRKAIALASGPNVSTTRASTHFNNGRIYEDAGQWADALREYEMARNERINPTYDNAIERMREHGAP